MPGDRPKKNAPFLSESSSTLSGQIGKSVHALRKNYTLSLSALSEQSGVAKSIISQIERNETNPTLATIWRLSQALDVSIEHFLKETDYNPFLEKSSVMDTPVLTSKDRKCRLSIIGWIKTIEWLQWYDMKIDPGGALDSNGHQRGSVECLSVLEGTLEVQIGALCETIRKGETLRYRCDKRHIIHNPTNASAHASMVVILKAAVIP